MISAFGTEPMPYFLIPLICSVALTAAYVFVSDAPLWTKILAVLLLAVSFAWHYGLFLQVGLSIWLLFYYAYLRARA